MPMRIGLFLDTWGSGARLQRMLDDARAAEDDGFDSVWIQHALRLDSAVAATLAGRATASLEVGVAVVPAFGRHPIALAQSALTTQLAIGGRFTLGIGTSHKVTMEDVFGLPFDDPVGRLSAYLDALLPLLHGEGQVAVDVDRPPTLLLGALGERMLQLAGARADGTVTWLTGPRTLGEFTVPTIVQAAAAAGRPSPRVVAIVPVAVTDDVDAAGERIVERFQATSRLPSYRRMLERERATSPIDVAFVGNEDQVGQQIIGLADAGVTDFVAMDLAPSPDDTRRTRRLLQSLSA